MKKWEYLIVDVYDIRDKKETLYELNNRYGNEGWELVWIDRDMNRIDAYYYFKREKE